MGTIFSRSQKGGAPVVINVSLFDLVGRRVHIGIDVDATDVHVSLPVGFEETTVTDVDEDVTELREVDGVQNTVTIRDERNMNRPDLPSTINGVTGGCGPTQIDGQVI